MAEGFSKSEIDRLGERIRASERLSVEDLRTLQAWRAQHADALDEVANVLAAEFGLDPTSRLKTPNTTVEKLWRESTRLSQIDDIAGCRVVVPGGLVEQDEVVSALLLRFGVERPKDRRPSPQHGYRAVHVVVRASGHRVEIQVRTRLQDFWAQTFERLADVWGRETRYGRPPSGPAVEHFPGLALDLFARINRLSELIRIVEDGHHPVTEELEVAMAYMTDAVETLAGQVRKKFATSSDE